MATVACAIGLLKGAQGISLDGPSFSRRSCKPPVTLPNQKAKCSPHAASFDSRNRRSRQGLVGVKRVCLFIARAFRCVQPRKDEFTGDSARMAPTSCPGFMKYIIRPYG